MSQFPNTFEKFKLVTLKAIKPTITKSEHDENKSEKD